MDSKDKKVDDVFDSLHHLPKVALPQQLYSKIEMKISTEEFENSSNNKYWQYAAAILIAINTLAYIVIKPTENDAEVASQYDDYIENYNWSQSDYYEYLTFSE